MKTLFSSAKRCLALVLALLLMVPAMSVAFASTQETVTVGELMISNYDSALTDAEKDMLSSGLLADTTFTYLTPDDGDELISVDKDAKTITFEGFNDGNGNYWFVNTAEIVVNEEVVETVALSFDGFKAVGAYSYDGNAFSVRLPLSLLAQISENVQQGLLDAMADLKGGYDAVVTTSTASSNLSALELAMPELVALAENGYTVGGIHKEMGDAVKAAVEALNAQMTANDGYLNLTTMLNTAAASAKTEYLLNSGAGMKAEVEATLANVNDIIGAGTNDGLTAALTILELLVDSDPTLQDVYDDVKLLNGVLTNLAANLEAALACGWTAAGMTGLVKSGITAGEYATLDTLVAALGAGYASAVTPVSTLYIDGTTLQHNMSMFNVVVNVVLETTRNNVVSEFGRFADTLTLEEGATKAEIEAAVAAKGTVAAAQAVFADFGYSSELLSEHFDVSYSELPEALTEDVLYLVTYTPKMYTVNGAELANAAPMLPYGYVITLPVHEDPLQAYDYEVNGVKYAQGSVITITGMTTITRTAGKSYTVGSLYEIIADNYLSGKGYSILTSGALLGDEEVNVRYPEKSDNLVTLVGGDLTASGYNSSFHGLFWNPYTYTVLRSGGDDVQYFNGTTATITGDDYNSVKVVYQLNLSDHKGFSDDVILKKLNLASTLSSEAAAQKAALDSLAGYHSTMGQLDKTKLGALNGVIDVTDFTPDDGTETDAKNLELRAYFKGMVGGIIANNLDSNNYLKIYNMLGEYNKSGLLYYYQNSDAVISEIESLSGYLTGMLADDEKIAALQIMVEAAGYPEYKDKIIDLESAMTNVKAALTAPNSEIDLGSENLKKLVDALESDGSVAAYAGLPADLVLNSGEITVSSDKVRSITVKVQVNGKSVLAKDIFVEYAVNGTIPAADIANILSEIDTAVNAALGSNIKYYENGVDYAGELNALAETAIAQNYEFTYNWTPKSYTVQVDKGDGTTDDQIININDLWVNLPASQNAAFRNDYLIGGKTVPSGDYKFTLEQIDALFVNDSYYVQCVIVDLAAEALEKFVAKVNAEIGREALILVEENGVYTGINADLTASDLMGFIMGLVNGGYSYVGLNSEALVDVNDENVLEISLQTLLNAILASDPAVTSQTVIDNIDSNGNGALTVNTNMQLGNAKNDIVWQMLDFDISLSVSGVPQLGTARDLLAQLHSYIQFTTAGDSLALTIDLPEKVYEVYVAALSVTGNVDLSDINAVDTAVAYNFLLDYVKVLTTGDVTVTTFVNTAEKLGVKDAIDQYLSVIAGYESYVNSGLTYLGKDGVLVYENGLVKLDLTAGAGGVNKLLDLIGNVASVPADKLDLARAMIKECKEGNTLSLLITTTVKDFNETSNFEAIVINTNLIKTENPTEAANLKSNLNVVDCVSDLVGYLNALAADDTAIQPVAVMLQKDITGDLVFDTTAILDLNGHTVDGSIVANGNLYIVDSSMDTANSGTVTGTVSGTVTILAGHYASDSDVSAYLKSGYVYENGVVSNDFYTISVDGDGNITFNVDADTVALNYTPSVKFLAADIAVDLLLNYYTTAALNIGGFDVYTVDFADLIALYTGTDRVNTVLDTVVDMNDLEGLINDIAAKLLDFGTMSEAIKNNAPVITYSMTTAPWTLNLEHVNENGEDYLTVGVVPGTEKTVTVNVAVIGSDASKKEVTDLLDALADVVVDAEAAVDFADPLTFDGTNLQITGSGKAVAELDLTGEYPIVIAVILAYSGVDMGDLDALLTAYNAAQDPSCAVMLKDELDQVTVSQIIAALKAMNRGADFADMAAAAGVTVDVSGAAELEKAYHKLLIVAGAGLDYLDITGGSQTLASLEKNSGVEGTYLADKFNINRTGVREIARGYGIAYDLTITEISLSVKLFDNCDHVYTGVVTDPTCTKQGYTTYSCACGFSYVADYVDATGHDYKWIDNGDGTHSHVCQNDTTHVENENEAHEYVNGVCKCGAEESTTPVYPPVIPTPGHCPACGQNVCHSKAFSDLDVDSWYHLYTDYVLCKGLMIGKSATEFVPGGETNRAMLVTTLYRFAGSPEVSGEMPYVDVAEDQWYSDAIIWATQNGIVNGYGNGYFGPFDTLTREQSATMFYRYAKLLGLDVSGSDAALAEYEDADQVSAWALDAVKWAVTSGMMNGRSTTELILRPKYGTTRAETAALLYRWCEEIAD